MDILLTRSPGVKLKTKKNENSFSRSNSDIRHKVGTKIKFKGSKIDTYIIKASGQYDMTGNSFCALNFKTCSKMTSQ